MSTTPVLATSADAFQGFELKTQISTVFLEHDNHVLLLRRCPQEEQSFTWGIPGGKAEKDEKPLQTLLREVKEETQITLAPNDVVYHGHRYARIPNWDYIVHIYHVQMKDKPAVELNSKEHTAYEWVSIYAFKLMTLLKGQDEVFDIVYKDRLWQRVNPTTPLLERTRKSASLVLRKGDRTLVFNEEKRFVLNLIGTSGSGKGTQGEMLSKLFGISNISAGDLFRDEFRAESMLGWVVKNYDQNHYPAYLPDEVPIGMMGKRLAEKDCKYGFILDGFPRTERQGVTTREVFLRKLDFHVPLFMDVPESDILERLPGRSICPDCGHQVRKFDENPWPGYCPIEGAKGRMVKLEQRGEDVDTLQIERRLKIFRENKEVILSTMNQRDPVQTFSLNNKIPPREVLHRLCEHIQTRLDQLDEQKRQLELNTIKPAEPNRALWSGALVVCFVVGALIGNRLKQ